jgi:hypothetical protein
MGGGTPVAGLILVHPSVQIKPVEGDALLTDGNLDEPGPHFFVETVAVHAKIRWRISKPDQPW